MTDTTDEAAFLRTICEYPIDLTPRLVYADWLEENAGRRRCPACPDIPGKIHAGVQYGGWETCERCGGAGRVDDGRAERAEFIRLMCEPVYSGSTVDRIRTLHRSNWRDWFGNWFCDGLEWSLFNVSGSNPQGVIKHGFVEEIRFPLRSWVGQTCPCGVSDAIMHRYHTPRYDPGCSTCRGTGRTPEYGRELVGWQPVTKVVVTNPDPFLMERGDVFWWRSGEIYDRRSGTVLPSELCPDGEYPTREAAETALSRKLVDRAREKAGLTPIKWEVV